MDKRNNSSAAERIELLQKYVEVSLEVKPGGQLEDKKFIGEEWFSCQMIRSFILVILRANQYHGCQT